MNSIFTYPNKDILDSHVDYKSNAILVTQKKGNLVLCKRGASFKPDIIMVPYKLLIFLTQYFGL